MINTSRKQANLLILISLILMLCVTAILPASTAFSTTGISPTESEPGELTGYTLQISNMKDIDLVAVTVSGPLGTMFPEYKINYFGAPAGWTASPSRPDGCETCAMVSPAGAEDRMGIWTPDGEQHLACCPMCALKMVKFYDDLYMEWKCDVTGKQIVIEIRNKEVVSVSPETARVIVGGTGCMSNKHAYDDAAVQTLLATAPEGAKVKTVGQALTMAKSMPFTPPPPIAITWSGRLPPGGYQEFQFVAENPSTEGTYAWEVTQTYMPHRCES